MKVVCIETKYKSQKWDSDRGTLEVFDATADLVIGEVYDFEPDMGFPFTILGYPKNLFISIEEYRNDIIGGIIS